MPGPRAISSSSAAPGAAAPGISWGIRRANAATSAGVTSVTWTTSMDIAAANHRPAGGSRAQATMSNSVPTISSAARMTLMLAFTACVTSICSTASPT